MAKILNVHPLNPELRVLERAVEVLRDGGVIVYPTDTVYGIGCDITRPAAIERISRIKGRDPKKPFSLVSPNLSAVSKYAKVSNYAFRILKRFLPGPYTFVLAGNKEVPKGLRSRQKTVGIRIPDHPVPLGLVRLLGRPIVSTSANKSGEDIITEPAELESRLGRLVDLILSCGPLPVLPSTVVSLIEDRAEVIRRGAGNSSFFSES